MKPLLHHVKAHYHAHYRSKYQERAHWVFMFDGLLVTIILGLLAAGSYFAFFYHPLRDDFRISVSTDGELRGAEEGAVIVRVTNQGRRELYDAMLTLHFPAEFRSAGYPSAGNAVEIPIDRLKPKASVEERIKGLLLGPPGTAFVYAHLQAREKGGQIDERLTQGQISWKQDLVGLGYALPGTIIAGETLPFKLTVKNASKLDFDQLKLTPRFPDGLKIKVSSPPLAAGSSLFGPLKAGQSAEFEFVGAYGGNDPRADFSATLSSIEGSSETRLAEIDVQKPAVVPNLKLQASFDGNPAFLKPGDDVPVSLRYSNAGSLTLRDVAFGLDSDDRIVETAVAVPAGRPARLDALQPGQGGEAHMMIRLKKDFAAYVTNPELSVAPTATFSVKEPAINQASIAGEPIKVKISGHASLAMTARYFTSEGDQIGRGILPPRVGKETRYWISTALTGGSSGMTDGKIEVLLPKNVTWTGRASVTIGDGPTFDAERHVILWHLGDIPDHAGLNDTEAIASFEVAIVPTADQVGTTPSLAQAAAFSGTDAWTGSPVVDSADGVTTSLPTDTFIHNRTTARP